MQRLIFILFFSLLSNAYTFSQESAIDLRAKGIQFGMNGEYNLAKEQFLLGLQIADKQRLVYGQLLYNMGIIENVLNHPNQSEYYFKKSISFLEALNDNKKWDALEKAYFNFASLYNENQNFETANIYLLKSLSIIKEHKLGNRSNVFNYIVLGNNESRLLDEEKALFYYNEAEKFYDYSFPTNLFQNKASSYLVLGRYKEALIELLKDSKLNSTWNKAEHISYGYIYYNLGRTYYLQNKFELAKEYLEKAYWIYFNQFGEKNGDVSFVHWNMAKYYNILEKYDSALYFCQRAIYSNSSEEINLNKEANPSIKNSSNPFSYIRFLHLKSQILVKEFKKNEQVNTLQIALSSLDTAITALEQNRKSFYQSENKNTLNIKNDRVYKSALQIAYDLYEISGDISYLHMAYDYSEKNKSSLLKDHIQNLSKKQGSDLPEELLMIEDSIKNTIAQIKELRFEEQIKEKPDSSLLKSYNNNLVVLKSKTDSILNLTHSNQIAKRTINKLDIKSIQKKLKRNQTLIEYSINNSSLYIFAINTESIDSKRIQLNSDFQIQKNNFVQFISAGSFDPNYSSDITKFQDYSNSLYDVLIKPIEADIKQEIIFVADDQLNYFPFELLIKDKKINETNFSNLNYLFKNHLISYLYSSSILKKKAKHYSPKKLLAFAPSYNNNQVTNHSVRQNQLSELSSLKFTTDEVIQANKFIKGKIYIGKEATENRFKAEAKNYSFVHLAMHSIIEEKNPLYSKLVFNTDSIHKDDNLLNVYEIMSMDLPAKLAVLSACNSGNGKFNQGEGVMSLARGFIYAGTNSVLTTLWTVDDKSGSKIMSLFYKELRKGKRINKAINDARIKYLESSDTAHQHPFYWANYILIGNSDRLIYSRITFSIVLGLLILTVGIFYFIRKYR